MRYAAILAAALLGLSTAAWADAGKDNPSDSDSGNGNQPHAPGQSTNPNPGKHGEFGPAWLSEFVVAVDDNGDKHGQDAPSGPQGPGPHGQPGKDGASGP